MDLTSYSLLVLVAFIGLCGKSCHGSDEACSNSVPCPPQSHWPVNCTDEMPLALRYYELDDGTKCRPTSCPRVCLPSVCPAFPLNLRTRPPGCQPQNVKLYIYFVEIKNAACFAGEGLTCN